MRCASLLFIFVSVRLSEGASTAPAPAPASASAPAPATATATAIAPLCSCSDYIMDCSRLNATEPPRPVACIDARTVTLASNLLERFPDGLTAFESVIASKNKIKALPSASQLNPQTRALELNDNHIAGSSQEFNALSSLRKLRLENNQLTSLNFLPLQCNLYSLDVSENAITSLDGPLRNCTELVFLGLSDNQITTLPSDLFSNMKKLKYLYLYNNRISSISDGVFSELTSLKDLSLQKNANISLYSESFRGLAQLRTLDLGFNNLQNLPAGLFSHTLLLVKISLIVNRLSELRPDVFAGLNSLQEILLWDNRLTQVPLLRNCCDVLQELNLLGNSISAPSEEALRAALRGNISTKIGKLPVRPEALRWALAAEGVTTFVGDRCRCGGLRKGSATVHLCVETSCGTESSHTDWVAAVRRLSSA